MHFPVYKFVQRAIQYFCSHFMIRLPFFSLLAALFICGLATAQNRSNRGREFWIGYGHNLLFTYPQPGYGVNSQTQTIYISTEEAATVKVSINGTTWEKTVSIPANTVDASVIIPKDGASDPRIRKEGLFNRAIHVESDVPVVVYAHQYAFWSSSATMLMPVETYGYKYFSLNYTQKVAQDSCFSWFYVIASEDNTRIEITPSDSTQGPPGLGWKGWEPGKTYTVDLKKGELYNVFGMMSKGSPGPDGYREGKDMTGSKIVSVSGADGICHPVAVFSGTSRLTLCDGDGGEVMQQQVFPASAWGTRYLTYHSRANPGLPLTVPYLNFYRVIVQDPKTVVKKNGVVMTGLIKNRYYEYQSDSGDDIESDKPVIVTQFTPSEWQCVVPDPPPTFGGPTGDPEMIVLSPVEQGIKKAIFYKTKNFDAAIKFVNIIVPKTGMSSLKLDGASINPSFTTVHPNNPDFMVASIRLFGPDGQHRIECDSAFTATTFGLGTWESYGYNAGTLINNLNAFTEIRNQVLPNAPADTLTCRQTPFRVFVSAAYTLSSIRWRFSETPGLNVSRDSLILNPVPVGNFRYFGRTYQTYSLDLDIQALQTGVFTLPVTYTSDEIDECSQTEETQIRFRVVPGPLAQFTASAACIGDTVLFTGTSQTPGYSISRYQWDFADGSIAGTKDTRKAFTGAVTQQVRYRIFADNGCAGDTTQTITLFQRPAALAALQGVTCVDSTIRFSSSYQKSGGQSAWFWDFGDGRKDSSKTSWQTGHAYRAAATQQKVRHWLLDEQGCKSDTISLSIAGIFPNPPAVLTQRMWDSLCPGSVIRFQASGTEHPAARWNWDLGGAGPFTQTRLASAVYAIPGTYPVKVSYTDSNGCGSAIDAFSVTIYPKPSASAGPDQFIRSGGSATIAATASNPAGLDIEWWPAAFLNDSSLLNPVSTPPVSMVYVLRVKDKLAGCSFTDTMKVVVLSNFFIPNTFTPNGDGVNDRWEIFSLAAYTRCIVEVYNTAGQQVYRSVGYSTPWDGRNNGRDLPAGTYYYVIDPGNGDPRKAGYVTLLR